MAGELAAIPDARRSKDTATDYGVAEAHLGDAALPDTVDLRRPWLPIADQGETASCVGWAVADSCLRWHLVEAGQLEPEQRLSPRYVWMAAKETDQRDDYPSTFIEHDGTAVKAGLDVVRRWGVPLEEELPFAGGLATLSPDELNRSAKRRRIMTYYNLHKEADRLTEWRKWLHQSGPVLVLVQQDASFRDGTPELTSFDTTTIHGSHAAALFGYGPGYFLLRSSWGTDWGEQGYARLSEAYAAEALIESYGVML